MKFEKCCENRNTQRYQIYHNLRPKNWDKDVMDAIQMLLRYIPNIDSVQSFSDNLIKNKAYDKLTFDFILYRLGMSEKDVLFIRPRGVVFDKYWDYYQEDICTSCQKIILVRQRYKTKTEDLLRCIGNAVAHGDFTIVGDMFVGFNKYEGEKKAIIKIKPKNLIRALEVISSRSEYNRIRLIVENLRKNGFIVKLEPIIYDEKTKRRYVFDILAEKDGIKYIFEIKDIAYQTYMKAQDYERILAKVEHYRKVLDGDLTRLVLVLDQTRLTKASWKLAEKIDNLIVLDINRLAYMPDTINEIFV